MAVPRNRLSNSRKNKRRAHDAKQPVNLVSCRSCGASRRPHTVCEACGAYGGRTVVVKAEQ